MIKVVVADDQELIRAGLSVILDAEDDLQVVGHAADGPEAARVAARMGADVIVMDVEMPDGDGIEGVAEVGRICPEVRVLMLTVYDVDDHVFRSLRAGASGYLLKTAPPEELVDAVRAVHEGRLMFAPSVLERLVRGYLRRPAPSVGVPEPLQGLSSRELEVFGAVARGLSNAEIGRELHLSEATVKTYLSRVLAKLGLRDRVQVVILAYECGAVGS